MTNLPILRRPIFSEKAQKQLEKQSYTFEVAKPASKTAIKRAIEDQFSVKVKKVTTANFKPKTKTNLPKRKTFTSGGFKKAFVVLSEGTIDLFTTEKKK